jgi:hypothetical protein
MLDCWLEVSLHLEGPATSQLDQGYPWFSLVPEQTLTWYSYTTVLPMVTSESVPSFAESSFFLVFLFYLDRAV